MKFLQQHLLQLAYGVPRETGKAFSPEQIRKILVIRRNGIGDMICALPLLRNIRAAWPQVQMDVIVGEKNACLLDRLDLVHHTWIYRRGKGFLRNHYLNLPRFLKPIRDQNYDLIIAVKAGFSPLLAVIAYASQIPWRLGYVHSRGHPMDFCFNLRVELPPEREHQLESCLRFLEPLGIPKTSRDLTLRLAPQHDAYADEILGHAHLQAGQFVLFNASSERPESRWTPDAIAQTALGLEKLFNLPMVLCGVQNDRELLRTIRRLAPSAIRALAEPPGILYFAALVRRSRFLMCGDGSPMHIAAAMKTPVFVLFSTTDPRIWGPCGVPFAHVQCRRRVSDISPSDVLSRIGEWLPGLTSSL